MKKFATTGISLIGKVRRSNEDSFIYTDDPTRKIQLAIVADGIGSSPYGDVASRLTCQLFFEIWESRKAYELKSSTEIKKFMIEALKETNRKIYNQNLTSEKTIESPMGSTIIALALLEEEIVIMHVGDSRFYELDEAGNLNLYTRGHTLYNQIEEYIADGNNSIQNKLEYSHILTKAVGIKPNIGSYENLIQVKKRDKNSRYLLCSDGLAPIVPDEKIRNLIYSSPTNEIAINKLISATYIAGASDNLTIILL